MYNARKVCWCYVVIVRCTACNKHIRHSGIMCPIAKTMNVELIVAKKPCSLFGGSGIFVNCAYLHISP